MNEVQEQLEGTPALMYTALWQTREMGFLKNILDDLKIKKLRILFYFKDYLPGGLITLDGELGDYTVESIDSLEGVHRSLLVVPCNLLSGKRRNPPPPDLEKIGL